MFILADERYSYPKYSTIDFIIQHKICPKNN